MDISNEICNYSLINYLRISAETQLMYRKIICNLNTDDRTSLVF